MRSATVLIADDSRTVRRLIRLALEKNSHTIVETQDGQEALSRLDEGPAPDLLITDVNMPRMDGLTLVREVRRRERFRGMPILVLTTECTPEMKSSGRSAGATGWLVKPFQPDQLCLVVDHVLRRA